jgi:hypothetical protein
MMSRAGYLSVVSGSSWMGVPYTWLRKDGGEDAEKRFLGTALPPSQLTLERIQAAAPNVPRGKFAPFESVVARHKIGLWGMLPIKGNEGYAQTVATTFLEPYRLRDHDRFFSLTPDCVDASIHAHSTVFGYLNAPGLDAKEKRNHFYFVERSRPYLIIGGSLRLLTPLSSGERLVPFETTPAYCGVPCAYPTANGKSGVPVGGGYVETFAYNVREVTLRQKQGMMTEGEGKLWSRLRWLRPSLSPRYCLGDAIGLSSAAPTLSNEISRLGWSFPNLQHVSPLGEGPRKTARVSHTDGGGTDNLGVASLVSRGVTRILSFVNTPYTYAQGKNVDDFHCIDDVVRLFGCPPEAGDASREVPHIFANSVSHGQTQVQTIRERFDSAFRAGKPLVSFQEVVTRANVHWGIPAGRRVTIGFVLLGPSMAGSPTQPSMLRQSSWFRCLPEETKALLETSDMRRFPNFKTTELHLGTEKVVLISQYASWVVRQIAPEIRSELGL